MFGYLAGEDMPWASTDVYQVDERIAPAGDPDRNLTHLRESLGRAPAEVHPMPVEEPDPEPAAAAYAGECRGRFALVPSGLGEDVPTASLVPGDPVLEVVDRAVAVTGDYLGRRRLTLTYPALARADQLLWLVTGVDKAGPLAQLLRCAPSIPAGRVRARRSLVVPDRAAAAQL
jgi:6-phosphogluconolactonase/glucosamine-6-phosphate isomerase/deaminase